MKFKKKIKKSSKKSNKKKDDWSLDGYQETTNNTSIKQKIKGPRRSQEKDEKFRRSRMKQDINKKHLDFKKKMQYKIHFNDVLINEDNEHDDNMINNDNHIEKQKIIRENIPNTKPVIGRLMMMYQRSHSHMSKELEDHDSLSDEIEELDTSDNEYDNVAINNIENNELDNFEVPDEVPIDDDKNEVDYDDEESETMAINYDLIFSPTSNTTSIIDDNTDNQQKMLKLHNNDDYDIFGRFHPNVDFKTINKLKDIPILHRMWKSRSMDNISKDSSNIIPYLTTYADTFIEGRNLVDDKETLKSSLLHICTHIVKARSTVIRHNKRIKRKIADARINNAIESSNTNESKRKEKKQNKKIHIDDVIDQEDDSPLHDQGFCRPRILILCPFRESALTIYHQMKDIFGCNTTVANHEKFLIEFSRMPEEDDDEYLERKQQQKYQDPKDYNSLFEMKNTDDDFKLGIQVNPSLGKGIGSDKGVYLRLFSDFLISDIIIASPLGLRLAIEKESENNSKQDKEKDTSYADYLSSLEIVFLYQADVMYMQNWDHVRFVLSQCNQLPKVHRNDIDFSRIRSYFLDGHANIHRQLICMSHFIEPDIQSLYKSIAKSMNGSIRFKYNWKDGSIVNVISQQQQIFQRITCNSLIDESDSKFQYFNEQILKPIIRLEKESILIVTPSYFDFIRVRNELIRIEADAAFICEYSRESEISRGRSRFYHGQKKILLYSGRAHFFRRFRIRGPRHVIFYSLPEYPHFYSEITNFLAEKVSGSHDIDDKMVTNTSHVKNLIIEGETTSCVCLFSKYEQLALERILGLKRCKHILESNKSTFMFK